MCKQLSISINGAATNKTAQQLLCGGGGGAVPRPVIYSFVGCGHQQ